jgi:Flp pilus assembly protein TadG
VTGHPERGQTTLLVIGFAAILLVLVAVVVDASQAVLMRRTLASLADGAALSAAQSLAEETLYTSGAGEALPLDPSAARAAVTDYLRRSPAADIAGLRVADVSVDPTRVTVVLAAPAELPLVNVVTASADGTTVTARATATSPLR